MGKVIRYALAVVCFAASVGFLALWQRSKTHRDVIMGPSVVFPGRVLGFDAFAGMGSAQLIPQKTVPVQLWTSWIYFDQQPRTWDRDLLERLAEENGQFGIVEGGDTGGGVYFPLWYPALVFALAGVSVLRFRRQFSIRSALVTVTVVAALLGMVVAL